ncbi:MAG: type II toxin-antitoxin system mRNA interferase toxin, RelE/StbE family [Proteobacteria bacterium]|nr:type II toxin-antitoxin system mRNA interferase toxin, RelE/StbE family [Pseudomonadota bacterium]
MYVIQATDQFLRQAGKFFKKHPDLKGRFTKLVTDLSEDPFQPALQLHPLTGKLEGLWAASLTYKYRITLTLMITEKEIIFLDVGSHDELYGKK